jgi:hypothetical protein
MHLQGNSEQKGRLVSINQPAMDLMRGHHSLNLQWISAYQLATQRTTLSLEVVN